MVVLDASVAVTCSGPRAVTIIAVTMAAVTGRAAVTRPDHVSVKTGSLAPDPARPRRAALEVAPGLRAAIPRPIVLVEVTNLAAVSVAAMLISPTGKEAITNSNVPASNMAVAHSASVDVTPSGPPVATITAAFTPVATNLAGSPLLKAGQGQGQGRILRVATPQPVAPALGKACKERAPVAAMYSMSPSLSIVDHSVLATRLVAPPTVTVAVTGIGSSSSRSPSPL